MAPVSPVQPPGDGLTWVEGARGIRLYVSVRAPDAAPRAVVSFVVGPEVGSAEPYPRLSGALREAGVAAVTVHPRGSGYSDGARGDVDDHGLVVGDLRLGVAHARRAFPGAAVFLFGHSAGAALALHVAASGPGPLAGVILVNPAFRLARAPGMGPTLRDYASFAFDAVFRRSVPTVDMNRDPSAIQDPDDRAEALAMRQDPAVVRFFSLRYLLAQRAIMGACAKNAALVDAPLLLVQGARDALVDPRGNDEILRAWRGADKTRLVAPGAHGASSVEALVPDLVSWLLRRACVDGASAASRAPRAW